MASPSVASAASISACVAASESGRSDLAPSSRGVALFKRDPMARATSTTVATNAVSSRRMRLHGATMAMAANVPDGPVTGAATQHTLALSSPRSSPYPSCRICSSSARSEAGLVIGNREPGAWRSRYSSICAADSEVRSTRPAANSVGGCGLANIPGGMSPWTVAGHGHRGHEVIPFQLVEHGRLPGGQLECVNEGDDAWRGLHGLQEAMVNVGHARADAKETASTCGVARGDEGVEQPVAGTQVEVEGLTELLRRRARGACCQCLEHGKGPPHRLQLLGLQRYRQRAVPTSRVRLRRCY